MVYLSLEEDFFMRKLYITWLIATMYIYIWDGLLPFIFKLFSEL